MKPLTRPTLKQLSIVSLCHVSVTNSTLTPSRDDGIYDHTKTILWVHHEELFWFHNQIATNIRGSYLCLRLFFSAQGDQTSPAGEIPLIICAGAAAPPVGGFDTRWSIFLKPFQRE